LGNRGFPPGVEDLSPQLVGVQHALDLRGFVLRLLRRDTSRVYVHEFLLARFRSFD
jgi:hypothetical protein